MCLTFSYAAGKGFVQTVNFILVISFLIYSLFKKRELVFVQSLLFFLHFAVKLTQQGIGNCFQPPFGFFGFFDTLGMFSVVSVAKQLFAFPGVPLTLDDSFFLSNLIAFINYFLAQLGIRRKSDVVFLHGGVR